LVFTKVVLLAEPAGLGHVPQAPWVSMVKPRNIPVNKGAKTTLDMPVIIICKLLNRFLFSL